MELLADDDDDEKWYGSQDVSRQYAESWYGSHNQKRLDRQKALKIMNAEEL